MWNCFSIKFLFKKTMMPDQVASDNELIHLVKEKNDSIALSQLTDRHTGIYVSVAQKYSGYSDKIQIEDIKEDRQYNIYQWILKYKPEKNMKFGTYVGEMTRYMCLDILNKTPDKIEMTEYNSPVSIENTAEKATKKDTLEQIKARVDKIEDKRFWVIFEARHLSDPKKSLRKIASTMGLTHEGVRKIYLKYINTVQKYITT